MKLRFGLDGEEPLTLAEIGRQINVSRERVRQLEAKAILKLRVMTTHQKSSLVKLLICFYLIYIFIIFLYR